MIFRKAVVLLPLWLAAPALAEPRSDQLLALLSHVPASLIESDPGAWSSIWFTDLAATSEALEPPLPDADAEQRALWGPWARVHLPGVSETVTLGLEGGWEPLVGFGPHDVDAGLVVGQPPEIITLLELDPAAAERVAPALLAHDYVEKTREGVTAFVRGAVDYGLDLDGHDPADPLGALLGSSSRVVLEGPLIVHARGWPALVGLVGEEEPKGHPDLPALGAALDLPDWGDAALLQAFFLPHQVELGAPGSGGLPPWRLGMVADLGSGTGKVALAMFTYTSRTEAEAAAQRLAEAWDEPIPSTSTDVVLEQMPEPGAAALPPKPSLEDITDAEAQTGVAGEGPFVSWLAVRSPSEANGGTVTNKPFDVLWEALMRRELAHFGAL